jgi:hypothetical protein
MTYPAAYYILTFGFPLAFAMNHVRFMVSPELYVVQETLKFDILMLSDHLLKLFLTCEAR